MTNEFIPGSPEMGALKQKLEDEITPAAQELHAVSREQILKRAALEGWSPSQAEWLDKLAKEPLFQAVADGASGLDAIEKAYGIAKRQLAAGYFDHAIDEGKNRYTAFLTVVDLEKQVAERRGETAPNYPDRILMAACRAVEQAAETGAPTEQQIAAGFAIIRELSAETVA